MLYSQRISKITGLIILHPLVITFIVLTSYPLIYKLPNPFWFIILGSFILAIVFLLLQQRLAEKLLLHLIFFTDIPLISALVYYTGGMESMFPLLYVLLIILSSMYLFRRGAYFIALSSVAAFFVVILLKVGSFNYLMSLAMYRYYVFALLFLFTGILSGTLSERYQKRVEEATILRLTTEDIIKNLPSGVITIDNNGDILYTNIPDNRLRAMVHLHVAKFLKYPETPASIELKFSNRHYILSCARIFGSNAGLAVLQDLTDIRKLEAKSRITQQTKLLAQLGGSLAHEIRNPLSSIRGALELIRNSKHSGNIASFINLALDETNRLNEIVTDFLNFAQFTPIKKNRIRISEVINEALIQTMLRKNQDNIQIKRKDDDFFVLADINKLQSGFTNILTNACEVSKKGQVVEIESYKDKKEGYVEISDHGHGIAKKDLKKIFAPFFTTKKGGTGLGLSIAKNIIEAHGGRIEVASKVGEGTTFKIALPLA